MSAVIVAKRPTVTMIKSQDDAVIIVVDTAETEQHDLSSTITDHPVEEGVDITDHQRPNPDTVTLNCIVSNTPLSNIQKARAEALGLASPTKQEEAKRGFTGVAEQAYAQLKQIRDQGLLVTVTTGLRRYESMALEHLTVPRDSKTYDAIKFTATFKFIRVVQNKLTRVVNSKAPNAQRKKSAGSQTPKDATKEDVDPLRSVNSTLSDGANSAAKGVGQAWSAMTGG